MHSTSPARTTISLPSIANSAHLQDVRHLLVVVVMQRHVRAFFISTRASMILRRPPFPGQSADSISRAPRFPGDVFRLGWVAHFMSPYNFAALSCSTSAPVRWPSLRESAFGDEFRQRAAAAVRAERTASQNVSSAPTASLNGNASERT